MLAHPHSSSTAIEQTGSIPVPVLRVVKPTSPREVEILEAETLEESYFSLRDRSQTLVDQGRLDEALEVGKEALAIARQLGDDGIVAIASCNVASVAIILGQTAEHVADLRSVLMRNFGAETSFAAAYNLSRAYEQMKDFRKSLFYGRIAEDRAHAAGEDGFAAKSLNQIGNGLVGESQFGQAVLKYQEALTLMGSSLDGMSVPPRINCAYCLVVLGQVHEGMGQLLTCLRWMKRFDALPAFQAWAHVFLCCGYCELDRYRSAWIHGMKARDLAERTGDYGTIKSSLFMLGEVERCAGDSAGSYEWFAEMQQRFYPDNPEMPQLMSQVGMTRVVNLRA